MTTAEIRLTLTTPSWVTFLFLVTLNTHTIRLQKKCILRFDLQNFGLVFVMKPFVQAMKLKTNLESNNLDMLLKIASVRIILWIFNKNKA